MGETELDSDSVETQKANHFCVLVHGLWGNPSHLASLSNALREKHGPHKLHVLVAKQNSNNMTYDGIEVGAERVAQEIEEELARLEKGGHKITKFSMVGYSLGGLIARYCIGLLYSRGWFDKLEPVNFHTFATPHLGVRAPVRGYHTSLWNALGGRTLSTSGRQLFLIDSFRDHGRPLLSVLADRHSVFVKALGAFKHRALYANVTNDRSAPWYTTAISKTDPFEDLGTVKLNYVEGYEPVIVDYSRPITPMNNDQRSLYNQIVKSSSSILTQLPLYVMLTVLIPIGTVVFLVNSSIQSIRSSHRIRLHESGSAGPGFSNYRIPLMLENVQHAVNDAIEHTVPKEPQEHLSEGEAPTSKHEDSINRSYNKDSLGRTLALTPEQFAMVDVLDELGFRKYPVHISLVRHSHAAIIVRRKTKSFQEGYVVIKHWLAEEFEL